MKHVTWNKQQGQIIIITAVFMFVLVVLVSALVSYAGVQIKGHRQALGRVEGLNIAEAGMEKAIWKLNNEAGYSGETNIAYGSGVYNVTVTNVGSDKIIKVDAFIPNSTNPQAKRSVQITATSGTTNISFNYGVQIGNGGLDMSNSSRIIGNVYSNANITGNNSARISGTAVVAGTDVISGMDVDSNATAYTINNSSAIGGNSLSSTLANSTVGGNAVADSISSCTIGGNATYDTKTSCTIGGTQTTPNPNNYSQQPSTPMPISDQQVSDWTQEAEAGGVIGSQSYSSGTVSLGPKKINGNLTVSNTATLNITGTLWVTGEINFNNSAIVRLDSSYGSRSAVIIAGTSGSTTAGNINITNSAQIQGSGTTGSYMLLLSQKNTTSSIAITSSNTGAAGILYAGYGWISLSNTGQYKEITAAKLSISNSATVTYESGLANAQFSSGPSGGWEVLDGTWQLLQ